MRALPEPAARRRGELLDVLARATLDLSPPARVRLGATAIASMILARSRMPPLLAVFCAVGFGYAAERGYVVVHDVHLAALALQDLAAAEMEAPAAEAAGNADSEI